MVLITAYLLLCLLLTFVFSLFLSPIFKGQRRERVKNKNKTGLLTLEHIPVLPLWKLLSIAWRFTSFLRYIGSIKPVASIKIWKMRVVFINDYKLGKELFKNPVFCGKNVPNLMLEFSRGQYGVMFSDGDKWKEQRRFSHQQLREFGFGTKNMETFIQNEVDSLIERWTNQKGKIFSPNKSFYIPILNSIWVLLAGDQASAENEELVRLVFQVYADFARIFKFPNTLALISKTDKRTLEKINSWLPIFGGLASFDKSITELRSYFQTIIDSKRKTLSAKHSPSDLVEAYLMKMDETTDHNSPFYEKTGDLNLLATMTDFFVAGGETTASMLAWAMLHLVRNPDIQKKISEEIASVVGEDRNPSLLDRPKCPYIDAFILEVLRFNPITLAGVPHVNTEETNIGQFFIEKQTMLFLNTYSILHDSKIWGDPQNFRPTRFLSEDGKRVVKKEEMCIFSVGLRRCVGEQVALDSMFLYVSSICRRFVLKPDPRLKSLPPVLETSSALHIPETFYMIAVERSKS